METHKTEWHFKNMHGIALIFNTVTFFSCFSSPDQDHFHCLFYYNGRVIAH